MEGKTDRATSDRRSAPERSEQRSVWLRPARARRTAPTLSRDRIVDAAVALLDAHGNDALTMRRLAEHLDVGAPTLYWHVATKDDVLDLAVDEIFGRADLPDPTDDWRHDVTELAHRWRHLMLAHPWSAALPSRQRPLLGPNFLAWMEFLQAALVRAGYCGQPLHAATWVIYNHVVGAAAARASLVLTDADRHAGHEQIRERADRFPTLAGHGYLLEVAWDDDFGRGLDLLLAGIASGPPATT